jgi:hypothetical protein
MTTGNEILTDVLEDKLFIPLEALYKDTVSFVYKDVDGRAVKQEVLSSWSNENEVVIVEGLSAGDRVYLTPPTNASTMSMEPLAQMVRDSAKNFLFSEREERRKIGDEKEAKVKEDGQLGGGGDDGGFVIMF